jgi:RimJ/RimL family protein N-acetyltransferase
MVVIEADKAEIVSTRLRLRPLRVDEAPRVVALLGHWEIIRWLAIVPWPYGEQDAHDFIAQCDANNAKGPVTYLAITERDTDQLMGHICLRPVADAGTMELGYWLGLPFWGRGYMSEAIKTIANYGFDHLGLRRVTAVTHIENTPSRKALEKSGFTYIGIAPAPFRPNRLRGSDFVHSYECVKGKKS